MNGRKKWLIIGVILISLGAILILGVAIMNDFNLGGGKYETNTYTITEDVGSIVINSSTADITVLQSEDGECRVVCFEKKNLKHAVGCEGGELKIDLFDSRRWYEHISFGTKQTKITVYLPKVQYDSLKIKESTGDIHISKGLSFASADLSLSTGDVECYASATDTLSVKTSTGDIKCEDISVGRLKLTATTGDITVGGVEAESIDASVSTGRVTVTEASVLGDVSVKVSTGRARLESVRCKSLYSVGSTGSLTLVDVIGSEEFSIKRSTGDVSFDGCDAGRITISTDTGDVRGSLLSEKIFDVDTDTGSKSLPNTSSGGVCKITTDTGDVRITIK